MEFTPAEVGRTMPDVPFDELRGAAPGRLRSRRPDAWTVANPALDDFLHRDALRATLRTSRGSSFRRFRLGLWVEQVEGAWLPDGAWAACAVDGFEIPEGTKVRRGSAQGWRHRSAAWPCLGRAAHRRQRGSGYRPANPQGGAWWAPS